MPNTPIDSAKVFAVLGESLRYRLWRLIGMQELSVGELQTILAVPQSTVSRHLKALRDAGLVNDRRVGTAVYYQQQFEETHRLAGQLSEWVRKEPLPAGDLRRLQQVLAARESGSRAFFDRLADHWDALRREYFGDGFAFQAMIGLLPTEWTVADVGCGTGYLLPTLAGQFKRVLAVDPAPSMLERARQRIAPKGCENVEFRVGNLEQLPLRSGEVNAAIASLVLHHTADPAAGIKELARVLTPGGALLVVELEEHQDQAFVELMGDTWPGLSGRKMAGWMKSADLSGLTTHLLDRPLTLGQPASPDTPQLYAMVGRKPL